MKFLFDFLPVIAFFVAFYLPEDRSQGIYYGTAAAIIAALLQVIALQVLERRVEKTPLITLLILLVLGGATLLLQDERFIKWKPTAVNWLFAVIFLGSQYIGGKNLVQRMLGHVAQAPVRVWTHLNLGWAGFFFTMGLANLYVAFHFSNEVWVNFKLFGILGLTLLFAIGQALYMHRYLIETGKEPEEL